jgi:hypothetical protein
MIQSALTKKIRTVLSSPWDCGKGSQAGKSVAVVATFRLYGKGRIEEQWYADGTDKRDHRAGV